MQHFGSTPVSTTKVSNTKLLPHDETLTEGLGTGITTDKIQCQLCEKQLIEKKMRKHIGSHILVENLENV